MTIRWVVEQRMVNPKPRNRENRDKLGLKMTRWCGRIRKWIPVWGGYGIHFYTNKQNPTPKGVRLEGGGYTESRRKRERTENRRKRECSRVGPQGKASREEGRDY